MVSDWRIDLRARRYPVLHFRQYRRDFRQWYRNIPSLILSACVPPVPLGPGGLRHGAEAPQLGLHCAVLHGVHAQDHGLWHRGETWLRCTSIQLSSI